MIRVFSFIFLFLLLACVVVLMMIGIAVMLLRFSLNPFHLFIYRIFYVLFSHYNERKYEFINLVKHSMIIIVVVVAIVDIMKGVFLTCALTYDHKRKWSQASRTIHSFGSARLGTAHCMAKDFIKDWLAFVFIIINQHTQTYTVRNANSHAMREDSDIETTKWPQTSTKNQFYNSFNFGLC